MKSYDTIIVRVSGTDGELNDFDAKRIVDLGKAGYLVTGTLTTFGRSITGKTKHNVIMQKEIVE